LEGAKWTGVACQAKQGLLQFSIGGHLRILVRDGSAILVDAGASCPQDLIRATLLGPALAACLNQRGRVVFHAAAFEFNSGAWAVVGPTGSGKSSLMAVLHSRGYKILCDELVAMADGPQPSLVHPEIPRLRLWADTMTTLGVSEVGATRVRPAQQRFLVPLGRGHCCTPLPLAGIFVLPNPVGPLHATGLLRGSGAFGVLAAHVYQRRLGVALGLERQVFSAISSIARTVPIIRLPHHRTEGGLGSLADAVQEQTHRVAQMRELSVEV
jgi:hypothetical protein